VAFQTYTKSEIGALRQGEIFTHFIQYQLDIEKVRDEQPTDVFQITHPIVVVLSQDCDLDQDYRRRQNGRIDNLLASVLFCSVAVNDDAFRHGAGIGTKEWKKVIENREPRLHYLRAVPKADDIANQGLSDLIVDFRQYFSLPTEEAYFCAQAAQRRCRLDTPYAEHLSHRFFSHMARVALPLDHHLPLPVEAPAVGALAQTAASAGADVPVTPDARPAGDAGALIAAAVANEQSPPAADNKGVQETVDEQTSIFAAEPDDQPGGEQLPVT
jgi:hypothetical protein